MESCLFRRAIQSSVRVFLYACEVNQSMLVCLGTNREVGILFVPGWSEKIIELEESWWSFLVEIHRVVFESHFQRIIFHFFAFSLWMKRSQSCVLCWCAKCSLASLRPWQLEREQVVNLWHSENIKLTSSFDWWSVCFEVTRKTITNELFQQLSVLFIFSVPLLNGAYDGFTIVRAWPCFSDHLARRHQICLTIFDLTGVRQWGVHVRDGTCFRAQREHHRKQKKRTNYRDHFVLKKVNKNKDRSRCQESMWNFMIGMEYLEFECSRKCCK